MRRFLLLALIPLASPACPLGPKEETLTLARVMRNFGRYLNPADLAVFHGRGSPEAVPDSELRAVVDNLKLAESCARIASEDRGGTLYPSKADSLSGAARDAYLNLFWSRMRDFLAGLEEYERLFAGMLAQPAPQRDFDAAKAQMDRVRDLASKAHESLQ